MRLFVFLLPFAMLACASTPPAVSPSDDPIDGGASPCGAACARRKDLGCIEPKFEAGCVATCRRASAAGLFNPACAAAATTAEAMAKCSVRCALP